MIQKWRTRRTKEQEVRARHAAASEAVDELRGLRGGKLHRCPACHEEVRWEPGVGVAMRTERATNRRTVRQGDVIIHQCAEGDYRTGQSPTSG